MGKYFVVLFLLLNLAGISFAEEKDKAAEAFFYRCAGCHTIGGGVLSGPDLANSTKWPDADLHGAIKRMEKNVGALTEEEIAQLMEFLKDLSLSERLAKQKSRIEVSSKKDLPPASFDKGQKLFTGQKPLANGGLSCIACHQFAGQGGSLGPELTSLKDSLSVAAMQSGIEAASYKVMRPIYEKHKITKEEAMHLAEYLSHPEKVKQVLVPTPQRVGASAWFGFGVFGVLLWLLNRQRKGGTREKLLKKPKKG